LTKHHKKQHQVTTYATTVSMATIIINNYIHVPGLKEKFWHLLIYCLLN